MKGTYLVTFTEVENKWRGISIFIEADSKEEAWKEADDFAKEPDGWGIWEGESYEENPIEFPKERKVRLSLTGKDYWAYCKLAWADDETLPSNVHRRWQPTGNRRRGGGSENPRACSAGGRKAHHDSRRRRL